MVINYQKPKTEKHSEQESGYDEEVMCANWNPAIRLAMSSDHTEQGFRPRMPADLTTIDVDAFLDRFYALSSHT